MGHSYLYRCNRCGYHQDFNRGQGYQIRSQRVKEYLDLPVKLFHFKTHNVLIKLAKKQADLEMKAAFEVYKCPHCKVLFDKVEVTVFNKHEQKVHQSEFRCTHCNARLKRTNIHRLKTAVCPVCSHKDFHISKLQNKLWD